MSRSAELVAAAALLLAAPAARGFEGIGRPATPAEIQAWDIDVRPDFQGLPRGSGSVQRGQAIWDARCASCHGTFGESNEVFPPLVGGTTPEDVKTGRVAGLLDPSAGRTTLMKLSTLSTLFDYVRRAMPWDAPRSLSDDDTYAVVAYLLNLGEIVPAEFVLDPDSIREVQRRKLPNRNGMTRAHGLWDVKGKPDVRVPACMNDCGTPRITSTLPDFARNSHGNLAEQNRTYGPFRGADTTRPAGAPVAAAAAPAPSPETHPALSLARGSGCLACHAVDGKRLGPSFRDLAARYHGDAAAPERLAAKVRGGGQGAWGAVPMPPQPQVAEKDIAALVTWILEGAP
jgi:cytochrome c